MVNAAAEVASCCYGPLKSNLNLTHFATLAFRAHVYLVLILFTKCDGFIVLEVAIILRVTTICNSPPVGVPSSSL